MSSSSDDEMQFLEKIIAQNKEEVQESAIAQLNSEIVLRCTYCQPTIGFEDLPSIKEHMIEMHTTEIIFMEQPKEIQEKTLKFHRDFYNSVGYHRDEVSYRLCKCTSIQNKLTRAELYLHSIEANHYPLVQCEKCGVLMEREDAEEHLMADCDPLVEGSIFLEVVSKKNATAQKAQKTSEHVHNMGNPLLMAQLQPKIKEISNL